MYDSLLSVPELQPFCILDKPRGILNIGGGTVARLAFRLKVEAVRVSI